jgi:hypothetical protein
LYRPLPGPDPAHVQQVGDGGGKSSVVKRKARAKIAATKQKRKAKLARAN